MSMCLAGCGEILECSEIGQWHNLAQFNCQEWRTMVFTSTSHGNNSNFITFAHYELIVGWFLLLRKPIFRFFSAGRTHKDGKWGIFEMNWVCR